MISWIKNLLGLNTPIEKKKIELSSIRHQAFYATRNGNLRKAGELSKRAEEIEDEIVEMIQRGAK
tara:strand:+ start:393 stop:587 length:195 start_codon:yes stop_codon:yes gene_type:complete